MSNYNLKNALRLCLDLLCIAYKENYNIEDDLFLSEAEYCLELAGVNLTHIKKLVQSEMQKTEDQFLKEAMLRDCEIMPVSSVAKKYNTTTASVYYLCNKNNIKIIKKNDKFNKDELIETITNYNGAYTLDKIAKMTHHGFDFIKNFCVQNNLKYKTRSYC